MNLDVIAEVWEVLRRHIDFNSRKDAAEELVAYMIENNLDVADIQTSFRGDKDVVKSLAIYDDRNLQDDDDDDYDDNYDDEGRY